ncbi:hypothetical protein ElyMa_005304400 [Elysia marginata]|uniref:Uncharacterized protein n=1 Tax=Elysia marginata TaxID=1093978 RepID=A0AAV4K0H5_9GAST|nr:hypothetical protein ElyMa_005304400 [Elysia marginata]
MADSGRVIIKISLIFLVICLILFVIGYASPYWEEREFELEPSLLDRHYYIGTENSGLWTFCQDYERWNSAQRRGRRLAVDECYAILAQRPNISGELRATQLFETLGLIGVVVSIVFLLVSLCVESGSVQRVLPIIASLFCLASGTVCYSNSTDGLHNIILTHFDIVS